MSVVWPLVSAVVTALRVPAVLTLATGGVFDTVAQGSTFPYVRVGSPTETRQDTFGAAIQNSTIQVHVFSIQPSTSEAGRILTACETVLEATPLVISDYETIALRCEQTFEAGLEELAGRGTVRHYLQIYRVWTASA